MNLRLVYYLAVLPLSLLPYTNHLSAADRSHVRGAISEIRSFEATDSEQPFRILDELIRESEDDAGLRGFIEEQLAGVLTSSASVAAKQRICIRLQILGPDQSVSALSELLASGNATLVEAACLALSGNPSNKARKALRETVSYATGKGLVAIIHLLGQMRDDEATMPLIGIAQSNTGMVQSAAFNSLGELASTPATQFLEKQLKEGDNRTRRLAGLALVEAAQVLEESAHPQMALNIHEKLLSGDVPGFIRRGAFLGKHRLLGYRQLDEVLKTLQSDDVVLSSAALSLVPHLEGKLATLRAVSLVIDLTGERQLRLIGALGRRGDASAVPGLLALFLKKSGNEEAILKTLGELGDAGLVPLLLETLRTSSASLAPAIYRTISRIQGETVDHLLLEEVKRLGPMEAKPLLGLLAERSSQVAVPVLFELASQVEGPLSEDALRALRNCGQVEHLPDAVDLISIYENSPQLRYVREMLASVAQKSSSGGIPGIEVLAAIEQHQPKPVRLELLHVMGMVRDPLALDRLQEVFRDDDSDIRLKAFEAALRIAQMSVSREENNPAVETIIDQLSRQSEVPTIRKQAMDLAERKNQ